VTAAAGRLSQDTTTVPWHDWPVIRGYVDRAWDPLNAPHHAIVGLTGSGKSYLAINGILKPLCRTDRVLIVDTKEDDPLVSQAGRAVREIPRHTWEGRGRRREDYDHWYRLVVHDDREKAREQVYKALRRTYAEGNWVLYFDELRDITDRVDPGLGLMPQVDVIYRKGRTRKASIVAATQAPRWVPSSFYDQSSFAWIGRIRDEERQKRLREISGMQRAMLPVIGELQRREWLLAADNGEFFARTKVTI
jgi:hypothetical protein